MKKISLILSICGVLVLIIAAWVIFALLVSFASNPSMSYDFNSIWTYLFNPIVLGLTLIAGLIIIGYFLYIFFKAKKKTGLKTERTDASDIYDNARFLNEKEINKYYGSTLNKENPILWPTISKEVVNGLIINSKVSRSSYSFNCLQGTHSLVIGTTGSGKTKYLLIPSVLAMANSINKPSLLVLDIKGEIVEKSYYELVKNGYEVHLLDFRAPELSERYNPLKVIMDNYKKYLLDKDVNKSYLYKAESEINKMAELVCPVGNSNDPYWAEASQKVFKGIVLGLLEDYENKDSEMSEEKFNFQSIVRVATLTNKDFSYFFKKRSNSSKTTQQVQSIILSSIKEDGEFNNTLTSVMSTFQTALLKFVSSASLDVTLTSDFLPEAMREIPYALFIILPDEDKSTYPLASLITNQIYNLIVSKSQEESIQGKRDIHFILDEFANLPKFAAFDNWLSAGRERRIFISIFLQSLSQLNNTYGKEFAKTIIQNCTSKIILGLSENENVDYFKKLFGTYTIKMTSQSISAKDSSTSSSNSLSKANLVNDSDLLRMLPGDIYFIENRRLPGKTKLVPIFDEHLQSILNLKLFKLANREHSARIDSEKYCYRLIKDERVKEVEVSKKKQTEQKFKNLFADDAKFD